MSTMGPIFGETADGPGCAAGVGVSSREEEAENWRDAAARKEEGMILRRCEIDAESSLRSDPPRRACMTLGDAKYLCRDLSWSVSHLLDTFRLLTLIVADYISMINVNLQCNARHRALMHASEILG